MNALSMIRTSIAGVATALLVCAAAHGQEGDDRAQLLQHERQARARVERLKREQDFLLFQKTLYAADSKYLVLDVRTGWGTLKYRNRTLKSFRFATRGKAVPPGMPKGAIQLSSKFDGKPGRRQLVFGDSRLVIQAKNARVDAAKGRSVVRIGLGTKDLGSLFYALEPGSFAYVTEGLFSGHSGQ